MMLLKKEKDFTCLRDQLSQERRGLPWVAVEKEYVFEGPNGKETLHHNTPLFSLYIFVFLENLISSDF